MRRQQTSISAACALLLLALLAPTDASAQGNTLESMKQLPGGNLRYRTLTQLEYLSQDAPSVMLAGGFGMEAEDFRRRVGGAPGWGKLLYERGYNAWMLDNVGQGQAQAPPDRDLDALFEHGLYGHYQIGYAGQAGVAILHGQAAGLGLRAASLSDRFAQSLVLIDPIGPPGAQPKMDYDPARLMAERRDPDHVWRTWGFGPARGEVREGLDLTAAQAESLTVSYDGSQPPYWAAMLTGLDSPFEVREPMNLAGVPVLVVRTPAADAEQIEREEHVIEWMTERGMRVETWDLSDDPVLKNVSAMPWQGELAPQMLDRILEWYTSLEDVPVPMGR